MEYQEKVKAEALRIVKKYEWVGMYYPLAKECALLEIDGRIEEVKYDIARVGFLNDVKKEIENL
jgi:hypothetical protein